MQFINKIIFLISYEKWGDMLMSKHHYAIELARRGNKVYFITNVYSIEHRLMHPFFLKHKFRQVYKFLTSLHIKKIIRTIGVKPDIVFSFDAGDNLPLSFFNKKAFTIYMPVDGPFNHVYELNAANSANVIISVTSRILERYNHIKVPKLLINHGVSSVFINESPCQQENDPIRIGYSGSLVRNDLDIAFFKKIIADHPGKIFEFWGENDPVSSSIHLPQDVSESTKHFLSFLRDTPNVILHGAVTSEKLAIGLKHVDALLIAYNIRNDQNHHKVLEYLGTGKVIVSSYMSSYASLPGLIEMVNSENGISELSTLFNYVMSNLPEFNTIQKQNMRIDYAKQFTYEKQVSLIEQFVSGGIE
jgi:hypothetical protein